MTLHVVRIHEHGDGSRNRVADFCKGLDGRLFCVREIEATRPHYQAIIDANITQQALRKRLKTAFPECVGNKEYSVKAGKDFDGFVRYLCKGERHGALPDVVSYCGFEMTATYVQETHDAYWKINQDLKKKATSKENGIVDQVYEEARTIDWGHEDQYAKRREICRLVVDKLKERKTAVNMFYARGVFNAVMLRLDGEFEKSFIDEIISKY